MLYVMYITSLSPKTISYMVGYFLLSLKIQVKVTDGSATIEQIEKDR